MITDLSNDIVKKINETSLDSLKVVLQGIQSELGDSQKKIVGNQLTDMIECQNGVYPFFCRGPNPTDVESLRLKLATIFMYYPDIAGKYLKV